MMEQKELDALLQVIENPVRRRIIKRLSQEPAYALQISRELGLSQALVAKHLAVMESSGLVTSSVESSSSGPNRKRYALARSVSITMDLTPNMFMERGTVFDTGHPPAPAPTRPPPGSGSSSGELRKRVDRAVAGGGDRKRLSVLSQVLEEVDSRLSQMESERMDLLEVRNEAMHEAAIIAAKLEVDKRKVLFHILEEHDIAAERISESLNLRELAVRRILEELQREFFDS